MDGRIINMLLNEKVAEPHFLLYTLVKHISCVSQFAGQTGPRHRPHSYVAAAAKNGKNQLRKFTVSNPHHDV